MKITNKLGLPRAFEEMAKKNNYAPKENEYRVTSLLKGIREAELERRHEITRDVSEMIWMLWGTAAHSVLENQQEGEHEFKETRLKVERNGVVITGQFDLYNADDEKITDYKTTSVWKIIHGDFADWRKQTLIYAWMMRETGFPVRQGEIVAMMRDHNQREARFKPDYPNYPVQVVKFNFTEKDFDEIELWLDCKIDEIKLCRQLPDDRLPVCTPEERFNAGDKYAVLKKGRKTALRVLNTIEDAENWMKYNGGDFIEQRKGEDKKCESYCAASEFCSYWRETHE